MLYKILQNTKSNLIGFFWGGRILYVGKGHRIILLIIV